MRKPLNILIADLFKNESDNMSQIQSAWQNRLGDSTLLEENI